MFITQIAQNKPGAMKKSRMKNSRKDISCDTVIYKLPVLSQIPPRKGNEKKSNNTLKKFPHAYSMTKPSISG
jgi:hypothetical protein